MTMTNEEKINRKLKDQFVILRASGETFNSIATKLDVPVTELIEWSRELKEDISNLKVILYEEKESASFTKRSKRVEILQAIAERVKEELATRDLKDVPTDKLISLMSKLTSHLKEDEQEVRFELTRKDEGWFGSMDPSAAPLKTFEWTA